MLLLAADVQGRQPTGRGRYRLWQAVAHPYCLYARVGRPSQDELERHACPFHPSCPIPFPGRRAGYCVCPVVAARNLIFLAARFGEPIVRVPSADSPAAANAARRAGLGQHYENVPLREDPAFDQLRKHGVLAPGVDASIWEELASWWAPPEYVTVDVGSTIREGRIVAATQSENRDD
jgi:hypothetical protein